MYNRVCCVDSDYCLFLYLLYSSEEEIKNTFFFFSDNIPESVREYFRNDSYFFPIKGNNLYKVEFKQILIHLFCKKRWPFLSNSTFWGMPYAGLSCEIIGGNDLNMIEEGFEHMGLSLIRNRKFVWLRKILHGPLYDSFSFNKSPIKRIVLTRDLEHPLPSHITKEIVNINNLWSKSFNRNLILESHGINLQELDSLRKCKYLLVSQTFSEDGLMTVLEEIELYKRLLGDIDVSLLCIKPHPRERLKNYSNIFPGAVVFRKKVPVQIFNLEKIVFNKVYTICSTGASLFTDNSEVVFGGTKCHQALIDKFGEISGILNK